MEVRENEAGGQSVILNAADKLNEIPGSHQFILTDDIVQVFDDPKARFHAIRKTCPFSAMSAWLEGLLTDAKWSLELHTNYSGNGTAGFHWSSSKVRSATIMLPLEGEFPAQYPASYCQYYDLVDDVDWNGFGCAGGLNSCDGQPSLSEYKFDFHGDQVDLENTQVWGYSPCGDMIIWSFDDKAGWVNHGSHQIYLLGSIADCIEWVYSELLNGRVPEWQESW